MKELNFYDGYMFPLSSDSDKRFQTDTVFRNNGVRRNNRFDEKKRLSLTRTCLHIRKPLSLSEHRQSLLILTSDSDLISLFEDNLTYSPHHRNDN